MELEWNLIEESVFLLPKSRGMIALFLLLSRLHYRVIWSKRALLFAFELWKSRLIVNRSIAKGNWTSKFYGNGILCNDSIIVLSPRSASISKQATRLKKKKIGGFRGPWIFIVCDIEGKYLYHIALYHFSNILFLSATIPILCTTTLSPGSFATDNPSTYGYLFHHRG